MSEKIACPKCGSEATAVSKRNPIRNAVQSTIVCRNCGFTSVREHPPDVTLSEWLAKK
ncbi:MAG: ogr/Delta-like zinc finger family protein [Thaumarchaeota archaeon]|nr:ogr/Delta-like zinc finger family protein [Nitrososphaerota archaeon]